MEEEDIEHFVAKTICAAMMDVMKIHTITITVNNDGNGRCDKDFVANHDDDSLGVRCNRTRRHQPRASQSPMQRKTTCLCVAHEKTRLNPLQIPAACPIQRRFVL